MTQGAKVNRFSDVRWLESTGSTNADVLELGRNGEAEGVVVVADAQTAGRGRHGRTWVAPPGSGLLFSILLRPTAAIVDLCTPVAALAVADVVASLGCRGIGIKWPNDVIVADEGDPARERKLVGILAEADWTTGTSSAGGVRPAEEHERVLVALGIGLNFASSDDFPEEVLERRIALGDLIADLPERSDVLKLILDRFAAWYDQLSIDRGGVLDEWRARCVTVGRSVRVDLGTHDLLGTATDLDGSGRLVVQSGDGEMHVVSAGDVMHLRTTRDE